MPKNIIFCADGTWGGDSQDPQDITKPTNVLKLFHNLAGTDTIDSIRLSDEQERVLTDAAGETVQIAKYLHGVGDSSNPLVKMLGGTIGVGLIARIIRGYTFISRNYQHGDSIHLVGFSRGAYTARALAGLISAKGLLDASQLDLSNQEAAYKLGSAVWTAYRRGTLKNTDSTLGKFEELVTLLPGFFDKPVAAGLLIPDVPIQSVAVWDTVGSIGIPEFETHGDDIEPLRFVDNLLSKCVAKGFHAIALDECRRNFPSCPWSIDPRVVQLLFPGAHSDVGGDYPEEECGLANAALNWMSQRLVEQGVLLSNTTPVAVDATGVAHEPWNEMPWKFMGTDVRTGVAGQMAAGFGVHQSVKDRMQHGVGGAAGQAGRAYAPANLKNYLGADGVIHAELIAS